MWGVLQPVAGALSVRWGLRSLMVGGSLLYLLGMLMLAGAQGTFGVVVGAGLFIGASMACTGPALASAAVSRPVSVAMRSAVLGAVSAAGSLGAMLSAPIGQALNQAYGWRVGVIGFAILALIMLPAAWYAGKVDQVPLPPSPGKVSDSAGAALGSAITHVPFIVLTLAFFVCGMQLIFLTTHLPSYLQICGMDPMLSAQALGVIGGFNVLGSLFFGWAGGRWNKLVLLGGIYLFRSLALLWYFATLAHAGRHAGVRRGHGLPVARRRPVGDRLDHRRVRPALAGHARRRGVREPPGRQLRRRLRRRPAVRPARLVQHRGARGRGHRAGGRHRADRLCAAPIEQGATRAPS